MDLDALRAEFCPPLDSSLLAAFVAELPDPDALRTTLKELATHANAQHEFEFEFECDFSAETAECSATSDSSALSLQSFSSPFGFLRAALPHIPPSQLRRALSDAGSGDDGDMDMESVVETLLTNEFIRELEERGLDALDDESRPLGDSGPLWKHVENKKKSSVPKKKTARGKTFTLVDVRQKQHVPPPMPPGPPPLNPWTILSSLSDHFATLLPPHPASLFQSHFHSPGHSSPANALRAALSAIAGAPTEPSSTASPTQALFALLDVLRDSPVYASLDAEQRSTLYADAQLALSATHGRGDDAIDIVWLLLDLEQDHQSGNLAMGVYHLPQFPLPPTRPSPWVSPSSISPVVNRDRSHSVVAATRKIPTGPPPVQPPPTSRRKSTSVPTSPASPKTTKPNPFQWQTIPQKPPPMGPHPLALHIPAYDNTNQTRRLAAAKLRGSGNGIGKGGKGDVGDLTRPDLRQRMATSLRKRDELLREASKAWRKGNAKSRGGEVALYFAERAREFQELARREALNEARIMVESKRSAAADHDTIDLHGISISEAVVIVREILELEGCSAANPLRIITGRGSHSANGVGVLKPAVRNALTKEGWNVGVWDGGLVVRGRISAAS